ncbi:uncharacterized protein BXZ73DRAFT_75689 [Epithele typhae]|uniref:uncharacterized protein n=1 Tax=Epithele typhae TaxID=378194 RepID=UPI0020073D9C|nr:uncharacterized protein BXZ73DRAFT_75689 [Epithele typhae]KAH9940067.1 hypothetical protein BXZ73DRAFT_75689 [Epithele typhae]
MVDQTKCTLSSQRTSTESRERLTGIRTGNGILVPGLSKACIKNVVKGGDINPHRGDKSTVALGVVEVLPGCVRAGVGKKLGTYKVATYGKTTFKTAKVGTKCLKEDTAHECSHEVLLIFLLLQIHQIGPTSTKNLLLLAIIPSIIHLRVIFIS